MVCVSVTIHVRSVHETGGASLASTCSFPLVHHNRWFTYTIIHHRAHTHVDLIHVLSFTDTFSVHKVVSIHLALLLMASDQNLCDKVDDGGCWLIQIQFGKQMANILHGAARLLGNKAKHPALKKFKLVEFSLS